jgi:hypothetical protein
MARCVHSIDREGDAPYCDVMIWTESEAIVTCNGRTPVCLGRGDDINDTRDVMGYQEEINGFLKL